MHPELMRFQEEPENEPNQEIVSLETARFIDRLEPEYEAMWQEMVGKAHEASISLDDFATKIWMDEDMPQAIRDRSMLLMVGNADSRQVTGKWSGGMNMRLAFFGFDVYTTKKLHPEFDYSQFKEWIEQARAYESQNIQIVSDYMYREQTYSFYSLGLIDQREFEQTLEKFDWRDVSPSYGGTGWNGDSYPLSTNRFPYLSDILSGEVESGDELRCWARDKVKQRVLANSTELLELPAWQQVSDDVVISLVKWKMFQEWSNDEKKYSDIVVPAINKYGWGSFITPRGASLDAFRLMNRLSDDLKASLIQWILTNYENDETGLDTNQIITLRNIAWSLDARYMFDLANRCLEKSQTRNERHQRHMEQWREEQRKKAETDPKAIAERQARQRFRDMLDIARKSGKLHE